MQRRGWSNRSQFHSRSGCCSSKMHCTRPTMYWMNWTTFRLQLEQQVKADDANNKVHQLISRPKNRVIKLAKHMFGLDPTLNKLSEVVKKLGEVAADVGTFDALVSNAQQEIQQQETKTILKRETGPLLTDNKVFGREKQRDKLLRWLTTDHEDESNLNVSLLSVVGHGGMGKTTLAQLVYNDEMVQKSFHLKIWVCVSTSFDVRGITRSILEHATEERPHVDGLPALQDALKEKLKTSGKFLLVLDDVWNDYDSSNWDKLLAPLKYGQKGSKILLTTRMDGVADMAAQAMLASTKESLKLGGLHGEDFYSLFDRYAFAGVDYRNYPNLQRIGKQIAKRLGGSPLAAKTVGGLLKHNLDDRYWTKILDSKNISDPVQNGKDNIMSILMLSYHHLPPHLRPCFAYCGMFPEDHLFHKEDLVLMWVAVGLVQRSHQNQGEKLEDIGGDYFDDLLRRSFFDQRGSDSYVMHDLLHDLAQSVSHGECCSFVDDDKKVKETIPNTIRHLYIESSNLDLLTKMDSLHNLCSLVLIIEDARPEHFSALEKVFKSLKSIRMLHVDLGRSDVTMPDAFSHLIHLRSLKIDGYVHQFPRSLCKLYHLQVLKFYDLQVELKGCPKLVHAAGSDFTLAIDTLSIDDPILLVSGVLLRSLTSVRRLSIWKCRELETIDGQLEQWFLQNQTTLEIITIYGAPSLKSLPGSLKNLSSLRYLGIWEASETLKERCRKDEGADWPTICHIPRTEIL